MAILCPIHKVKFEPVELRFLGIYTGFRNILKDIMQVWKAACPVEGCTEVIFYDGMGVVLDGVKDFPKEAKKTTEEVV
jgi:hypothetical protein